MLSYIEKHKTGFHIATETLAFVILLVFVVMQDIKRKRQLEICTLRLDAIEKRLLVLESPPFVLPKETTRTLTEPHASTDSLDTLQTTPVDVIKTQGVAMEEMDAEIRDELTKLNSD